MGTVWGVKLWVAPVQLAQLTLTVRGTRKLPAVLQVQGVELRSPSPKTPTPVPCLPVFPVTTWIKLQAPLLGFLWNNRSYCNQILPSRETLMQPARTLHSQATEKSLFVLRSNTWNTLSRAVTLERGALRTQGCPVFGRTGHLMLLLPPDCVWPTFISPWSLKQGVDKGEAAVQPWRRTMLIQCTVVQHLGHRRAGLESSLPSQQSPTL